MDIITLDYETFYDKEYSLSKLSEVEYILDERYQTILCAVQVNDAPFEVFVGHDQCARKFATIDWDNAAVLSHNVRFDAGILGWRYGHYPALYLDTLSMARATSHWVTGSSSLRAVADYMGLPPKGTEVVDAKGMRLEAFTRAGLERYAAYCVHDAELCRTIFDRLRPWFPSSELRLIDLFIRMFVQPQVRLDARVLAEYLHQVEGEKREALDRVASFPLVSQLALEGKTNRLNDPELLIRKLFASNPRFAQLLELMHVPVPVKFSVTKTRPEGAWIPALAKNDRGFRELLNDGEQPIEVQAVLAARQGVKSTLEERRTSKLLDLARRTWPGGSRAWAPVPLSYYAARTGRPAGDSGLNWLNFRRDAKVRDGIVAPPGYRIVHRDSSQIEARMVAWLSGCEKLLGAFRDSRRDVYCEFASEIYRANVTKEDKLRRYVGKTSILSLGYSSGANRFRDMLYLGNGGVSMTINEDEAEYVVSLYRSTYPEIPRLWADAGFLLQQVVARSRSYTRKPLYPRYTEPSAVETIVSPGYDCLNLPNNMKICYPNLRYETDPSTQRLGLVYDGAYGGQVRIYGGKATENISQSLARIVVTDIAVRVYEHTGAHPALFTYDSLDFVVPETDAEWWDKYLETEFAHPPAWAGGLPLASEGGWGKSLRAAERGANK